MIFRMAVCPCFIIPQAPTPTASRTYGFLRLRQSEHRFGVPILVDRRRDIRHPAVWLIGHEAGEAQSASANAESGSGENPRIIASLCYRSANHTLQRQTTARVFTALACQAPAVGWSRSECRRRRRRSRRSPVAPPCAADRAPTAVQTPPCPPAGRQTPGRSPRR